uniref:Helix-turn-helix protein, CopG family n=1 Tax=Chlorobium chlorochromatii (strain CaD3) TaxID=340177 RepID=Q3ATF6_CHLCH
MKKQATITTEELDDKFDAGEDISQYLDWSQSQRPLLDHKRINVDLPQWMLNSLDFEAKRVGVKRQAIVKMWLSERIKAEQVAAGNAVR